jgi:hypothetical protein
MAAEIDLVARVVVIAMGDTNLAEVIVPLQPLARKPVTEPVAPDVVALILERPQAPLPILDMVLNLPVPVVVL